MSVVVITGCSTGIGLATAAHLSKKGHRVYATMRHPENHTALKEMAAREDLPITVLPLDVTSDISVQDALKAVLDQEGRIDVLVNNAGVASWGAVEELPFALIQRDMETNYFGALRCIKAVLPAMREGGNGHIINITSVAGKVYSNFHGAYCASKAALEALSESLAQEVHPFGVRVSIVEPGIVETPIFNKGNDIPVNTQYPNIRRFAAVFAASLQNHVPPLVVAEVVREIIDGTRRQFRNPAGPDAVPLLGWRAATPDEEWIANNSVDEESWTAAMAQMGLNTRPYLQLPVQKLFQMNLPA